MAKYYIAFAREHRGLREPNDQFNCDFEVVPCVGDIVESTLYKEYFVIRRIFENSNRNIIRVEVSDTKL